MFNGGIEYKTRAQMRLMRQAGLVVAAALDAAVERCVAGATTSDVEQAVAQVIQARGALSNFKGYHGFPATACVSVNDEVIHGIPGSRTIRDGDVVSIDAGAIVEGWHGDSARTVLVGEVDPKDRELSEVTREALWVGIAAFAQASRLGEVGSAIDDAVAGRFGILEDYVGHGIGTAMHQEPDVLNYRTRSKGPKVKPGLCVAIEPMLVRGGLETRILDDEWTIATEDGERAAHWEHSVARHDEGIWVLTAADGGAAELAGYGVVPVAP